MLRVRRGHFSHRQIKDLSLRDLTINKHIVKTSLIRPTIKLKQG